MKWCSYHSCCNNIAILLITKPYRTVIINFVTLKPVMIQIDTTTNIDELRRPSRLWRKVRLHINN